MNVRRKLQEEKRKTRGKTREGNGEVIVKEREKQKKKK